MKTNLLSNLSNGFKKGTGLTQVGYRQGTGKVQAGEKQACGRKESLAWSQVELISDEGAIEHPFSTHSAPFGIRWKPAGEKGSTRVWKHVAMIFAVLVMSMANIGMAWGASGTITAAASTDLGSGNTPRYVVEQAGVGRLMKNATGSSSWSLSGSALTTGSNTFSLQTYNEISSIIIYGNGTGNNRTFSSMKVGTTTSNYAAASATGSGTMASGGATDQTITITPASNIAANSYVQINLSGNINIYSVELVYAGGVTKPTFSPATGSSLVKSTGTVTLTSAGNTVYYKWSQTDNQYASGDGATLAGAADGSGTSPVNATAPSTAGTWYLYAVAKNGGDYSDVVKATYTITNPTHTLTWNLDGGTATGGTAAGAVAEGATLTAPTVTKVGYDFAGWSPSVPATMPAADATYTATWTKVYASGTYNFYNNATLGTSPNQKTITTSYADYNAFRIDNIFFSDINMAYEGGSTATGSDYKGWKIKKNNATIKFFVENDSEVTISIGRDNTLNVSYTNTAGASQTPTITSGNSSTYSVKGGTMVTLTMSTSSTITIKQIAIAPIASCTAPSSVSVAATNANGWRYSIGETIDLTCTATGGTGTKTYQWQKYIGSSWTDIDGATNARFQKTNCTSSDGGSYRCVVSTGATCSLASDGYWVRVFTLNGAYYGGSDTENAIVWTDANTGVATVHLNASSTYMFKVTDNDGRWFGYGENNYIIQPVALDCGTENQKLRLLTGPEGDYTFTINVQHAADVSPYVNIATGYPTVSHPNSGYAYITKWWDCYVHYWEGTNNALTAWGSDPKINSDRYVNICGTDYWYFPVIDTYNKFIAKNNTGDATDSNTTGNQETTGHGGQYITHSGSWGWHEFSTYTITYTGNGGGGSMSATSGICPDADQAITSNAFTAPTGCASFAHWTANVAVKVGGATVAAGSPIANGATIEDINSNITLTAVWKLATPTITDNGDNTFSISGSMAGSSYYYTTNNSTPTTSSSLYSSAVDFSAGEANITAKAIAHKDGYVDSDVASQACTYHAPVDCPSSGTIFSATVAATSEQSIAASASDLSLTASQATVSGGSMSVYNGQTSAKNLIDDKSSKWYFVMTNNNTFFKIVLDCALQEGDVITIDAWGGEKIKDEVKQCDYGLWVSTSSSYPSTDPECAGASSTSALIEDMINYTVTGSDEYVGKKTLYIYRSCGATTFFNNINITRPVTCTTPAAPTAFSAGSITSTGATFSITDAGDAASYDIYYSTSSDAPTAGTAATTTSDSKTKAVTGLTASTTYYAWVRSVCDADHKSAWVALSGSSFETSAAAACDEEPHNWTVVATSQKSYKVRISKVSGEVAIPVADATSKNITAYAGTVSTNDNVTVNIADGGSSNYGYKFDGSNTYLKLVFSSALVLNDTLVVEMTNASHNISFTTTATRATTYSTSAGKLIIPAALAGQTTLYLWRGSGNTMYLKRFKVLHTCDAADKCTVPVISGLSDQAVCPGSDLSTIWTASQTAVLAEGETVAYSWKKKGSETVLGTNATLDLGASAAESQAGTYVVTVTVSKAGKASSSASKEVTLTVTAAVEEPSITASKVKVYPGDAVTLTATCGTGGVTWQWYTCTNAAGDGESAIAGEDENAYTIASAGSVGTYYYKVKATGSCASAAKVYTLNVLAADACDKEFWFAKEADRPTGAAAATHITGCPSGSSSASYTASIDGTNYTITGCTGQKTGNVTITVPADNTGTLYVVVQGSSSRTITLSKGGTQIDQQTPTNSVWGVYTVSDLDAGTYTLVSSGNISWGIIALKLCPTISCSDATPTATATNTTVCAGGTITITATGYEDGATFQWQKQNASTNAWENITDSTRATLCYASATSDHAGNYQVVATKTCARTSNTVTIAVPSVPVFGAIPASVSVMETQALSITTVEATDAVSYKWYKSANASLEAGDPEIGSSKELMKAYADEAIGTPSYYVFCVATNSCGADTTSAIAVNVTAYVEQDCAVVGSSGEHNTFGKTGNVSSGTYGGVTELHTNSNNKYIYYTAEDGYYFSKAIVNACVGNASDLPTASYSYSTDGGENWTDANLTGMTTDYQNHIINLPASVNAFRVGRRLGDTGTSSSTIYIHEVCFEYTERCTATTITVSSSSVEYEIGDPWSNPTFTLSVAGTLTYSSSNEDIASVDDYGTVTFNGEAGTVTITASYAGGTISATEYCASSGSYTINVSCPGGAPKIVPASSVDLSGCNASVTLNAKKQDGTAFADGTYQWFRNGEEIDGATSSSYTATQAGTYTVERTNTSGCTTPSTNSAVVTSETTEPEVERLVPFQYYHVDKTYTDQMKMRHLFAVKNSGKLDGKSFKLYVSRNGAAATDVTSSNALAIWPNADGRVDSVMVDLNKLTGKYAKGDELVYTCKAIDCENHVSETYKNTITMHVIDTDTATLALICSGASGDGTRKTKNLVVGGDFLTGYNKADLCVQTGNESFDKTQEWGLYTELKDEYIVTPVNGYAPFYKLNYEPFDILFLTDYPKASKSDAAKDILDDMAALCDYRPLFSFKTHMVAKTPSKWAAKGFTTSATENKSAGRLNLNIVCYAHRMFDAIKTGEHVYEDNDNTSAPLVYTMLSGEGYEGKKGMQGFEIAAAENFVTIGLTHYNARIAMDSPDEGLVTWTPDSADRMLVTVAERQANIEARMILFSVNAGAHSKLTDKGEQVVLACLEYLLDTDPLHVADCSFYFDNGEGAEMDQAAYKAMCPSCSGTIGDHKWSTQGNWGPDYRLLPGEFTAVRIEAPVTVDLEHAHVREVRIEEGGSIEIPAGKALDVKGTIRHLDGSEISPTGNEEISIGSSSTGNGTLIFNNNTGDTKARVAMYSNAPADIANMSAATSVWQYIGTPHTDVANARSNYYGSWIYQYGSGTWEVIPNGGPLEAFRGYCITNENAPIVYDMKGTLAATSAVDLEIPVGYTVIANSWVAPIDITTLTDDDMENISDKTVYFFNTGTDAEGTAGTGTAPGTYVSVPKNSASYVGTWQIPSMQGFYISTTSAGTLHLDYDRHVRPTGSRTIVSNPMYAPRRAKAAETDEPAVLKIYARGSRYHDKLVVLEREDFTRGYDSGWDGEAWGGSDLSPMVYVTGDGREDAVSAIPEFEGTVIAFKAGEDSEYRLDFVYDGEESLYLLDIDNNTYTQIMTGNAYAFTTNDKSAHSRFVLTRKAPQIATGIEPTSDSSLKGRAKKLLIDDKMYILLNGALYDATGKMVK